MAVAYQPCPPSLSPTQHAAAAIRPLAVPARLSASVAPEGRPSATRLLIGAWQNPARRVLQLSPCSGYSTTEASPVRAGAYRPADTRTLRFPKTDYYNYKNLSILPCEEHTASGAQDPRHSVQQATTIKTSYNTTTNSTLRDNYCFYYYYAIEESAQQLY